MTTAKTARCMKARKSSRVACNCYVHVGELIVNRGDGWRCWQCTLAAIRAGHGDGDGHGGDGGGMDGGLDS